jgi:D-glycerate 3-kinase
MDLNSLIVALAETLSKTKPLVHPTKPMIIGVSGSQGSGKSTLCEAWRDAYLAQGKRAVILGLDDFYLSKATRLALSKSVHPLCSTRGVPGTHDIANLAAILTSLQNADAQSRTQIPVFNKADDDLLPVVEWPSFIGRPDVIFIEGWCLGARSKFITDAMSEQPRTDWEVAHDPDQLWRKWTVAANKPYERIWDRLDSLIFLQQDNFNCVIDARWRQEENNFAKTGRRLFASRDEVAEFCAHYKTWTEAIMQCLPQHADINVQCLEGYKYLINSNI